MRGDLTIIILELIQGAVMTTDELLGTLSAYDKIHIRDRIRGIPRRHAQGSLFLQEIIDKLRNRRNIEKLLSKLKSEWLISKSRRQNDSWNITANGRGYVERAASRIFYPSRHLSADPSNELKIVSFDIPERDRGKRAWLRAVLKNLKFIKIQESVWAGKVELPEEFFVALRMLGLLTYVEIFAVTKAGSLRQIR